MHHVTPLELLVLCPAHRHPARPPARAEALAHGRMLYGAVFERGPPDLRFALSVAVEDVGKFFLLAFRFALDFALGAVVRPEVGVAAVGVEGCGGYAGFAG